MNIANFKKLTTFALLIFTVISTLISYPISFTRFYNEQTGQTLDLIGDFHENNDKITYADTCRRLEEVLERLNPQTTVLIFEHSPFPSCNIGETKEDITTSENQFLIQYALAHKNNPYFISADVRPLNSIILLSYLSFLLTCSIAPIILKISDFQETPELIAKIIEQVTPFIDFTINANPTITKEQFETVNFNFLKTEVISRYSSAVLQINPNNQIIFAREFELYKRNVETFFNQFNLNQPNLNGIKPIFEHIFKELVKGNFFINLNFFLDKFTEINSTIFNLEILKNILTDRKQHLIVLAGANHCNFIKTILQNNEQLGFLTVFQHNETKVFKIVDGLRENNFLPLQAALWTILLGDAREQYLKAKPVKLQQQLIEDQDDEELITIERQKPNPPLSQTTKPGES